MKYARKLLLLLIFQLVSYSMYAPPLPKWHEEEIICNMERQKIEKIKRQNEEAIKALGLYESGMDHTKWNSIGAMGTWQFIQSTLKHYGYGHITLNKFKRNPEIFNKELQRKLLMQKFEDDIKILSDQWWRPDSLDVNYIEKYVGTEVRGVKVTLFGILAMAHLGGAGGVINFFDKAENPSDINGTSLLHYLRVFSNYDYCNEKILNERIACLEKKESLIKYKKYLQQKLKLRSKTSVSFQRGKETAMILELQKLPTFQENHIQRLLISHSELKCHYQNTIEEFLNQEVPYAPITIFGSEIPLVKSNRIIQVLGLHVSFPLRSRQEF